MPETTGEDRIIELETKIMYQERLLDELNTVIIKQQDQIDLLTNQIKAIMFKVDTIVPALTERPPDEKPPHY